MNCEIQNISPFKKLNLTLSNFKIKNNDKTNTANVTTTSTKTSSTTTSSTTKAVECKNGGLLIDNICICLNKYSGPECEIAPLYMDEAALTRDKINLIESSNAFTRPQMSSAELDEGDAKEKDNKEVAVITFNRRSRGGALENITIQRNLVWPWFG